MYADLVDLRGSRPLRFAVYVRLPGSVLLPYRTIMKMVSRVRNTAKVADAGRKTLLLVLACHGKKAIASRDAISPGNKKAQAAYACGTWGDAACAIVTTTWTSSPSQHWFESTKDSIFLGSIRPRHVITELCKQHACSSSRGMNPIAAACLYFSDDIP